jgi:XRE family transcriptional regulator, regulator of sulfur utilization
MSLGSTVRTLRNSAGFSQKRFAESLSISPAYLSQIESDKREPTIPLLRKMADLLGSPATVLFAVALSSKLPAEEHKKEIEVIQQLVEAVRLNITSKQLTFGLQDAG